VTEENVLRYSRWKISQRECKTSTFSIPMKIKAGLKKLQEETRNYIKHNRFLKRTIHNIHVYYNT
jgi:hypothetical protein